jgi:hypothetical protein
MVAEDEPRGSKSNGQLTTVAGLTTAALAVAGVIWFGLLSLGAATAYGPAGVEPREIGLSSGTVLSQSAVGLALVVIVVALVQLVIAGSKPVVTLGGGERQARSHRTHFVCDQDGLRLRVGRSPNSRRRGV